MPSLFNEKNSRLATGSQHRNQLLWTGAVAILLGIVALQQASSPVSSTIALAGADAPKSVMTGIPIGDEALSPSELAGYPVIPSPDSPQRLNRAPSSTDQASKP